MEGIKECIERLAKKRGVSRAEATTIMNDVLNVIQDMCIEEGGVSFKGLFTIQTKVRKGRKGNFNGVDWKTEDRKVLSIKTGKVLEEKLNQ